MIRLASSNSDLGLWENIVERATGTFSKHQVLIAFDHQQPQVVDVADPRIRQCIAVEHAWSRRIPMLFFS